MTHIERLRKNIEDIAYSKGITIPDVEDGCELRHGYIQRMGNNQKGTIPLDVALKFAKFLGTTVDSLVTTDFSYLVKKRDIELKRMEIQKLSAEVSALESDLEEV